MKRKIFKVVSVIVGIMVIAASVMCATSIFAADTDTITLDNTNNTAADGIYVEGKFLVNTGDVVTKNFPIQVGFLNGDFSEGMKNWGFRGRTDTAAYKKLSDCYEITADGSLKFNGASRTSGTSPTYVGPSTLAFTLPGVAKDDVIKVVYKTRNTTSTTSQFELRLYEVIKNDSINATGTVRTSTNTVTPTVNKTSWSTKTSPELTVGAISTETGANPLFRIIVQANTVDGGFELDDIIIIKKNTATEWVDVMTGDKYASNGTPIVEEDDDDDNTGTGSGSDNTGSGSGTGTGSGEGSDSGEEDGMKNTAQDGIYDTDKFVVDTGDVVCKDLPIQEGFLNGDFSGGMKHWALRGRTDTPAYQKLSDAYEVTAEGALKFKGATRASGGTSPTYVGPTTLSFTLPGVAKDDTIKLVYKVRNTSDTTAQIQVRLYEVVTNNSINGDGVQKVETTVNIGAGTTDWTTKTTAAMTVKAVSTEAGANPLFRVFVQTMVVEGGFEIDDLVIIKKSGEEWVDVMSGDKYNSNGTPVVENSGSNNNNNNNNSGSGTGTGTGTGNGNGSGTGTGTSATTGDSIALLAGLLFVSGAGILATKRFVK